MIRSVPSAAERKRRAEEQRHMMTPATSFDTIPAPEAMEYHGELPTAFAELSVFSPLAEMRGAARAQTPPVPNTPSVAAWMSPHRTPVAPTLELPQLERFKTLMGQEHWPVHVARMLFDRQYAYDRIVLAHTSRSFELRTLAQDLFKVYQSRGQSH
jgi:hypothetical protein